MGSEVFAKLSRSEGRHTVFTAASQVRGLELDSMIDASRVLVVDDEESITELLSTALRYIGYDVAVAHTGREALDRTVSFRPDVTLLDVMLPDLDGFEVCRRLRNDGVNSPVIFLTARDATEDKVSGLELGAD